MSGHIDASLQEMMQSYLEKFFVCIQEGNPALNSFLATLSTFNTTVRAHHSHLRAETLLAVSNFASLISTLTSDVIELETTTERIITENTSEISKILSGQMSMLSITDDLESNRLKAYPAYIKPSYQWLLENLHNPYPPKETRREISVQTNCSVKDIDAWFIDVRKRIGWNKLRKTRFSNKQERIIAAATNVFQPKKCSFTDDLTTSLISEMDSSDLYRADFIAMELSARNLYADRFPELVRPAPQSSPPPSPNRAMKTHSSPVSVYLPCIEQSASLSYPTPEPSPPSYTADEMPLPTPLPVEWSQTNSRKRRQSFLEESCGTESQEISTRSMKRSRCSAIERKVDSPDMTSLAVPTPTIDSLDLTTKEKSSLSDSASSVTNDPVSSTSHPKRKRRLSDGDSQGPPKRPHNAHTLPRLQTISDPFPLMKPILDESFDGWFQEITPSEHHLTDTIPLPANVEFPISLAEVDLQQYDFSLYNPAAYLNEFETETDNLTAVPTPQLPFHNHSNLSSVFGVVDGLRDCGLGSHDSTTNLQFDLVTLPYFQPDFQCQQLDVSDDFSVFQDSESLSTTPGYIPDSSLLLGNVYSDLNSLDSASAIARFKAPVLGNSNHRTRQVPPIMEKQEAKRARAQALREELAQLVAEGL